MAHRATLMVREIEAEAFIPYGRHVDAHTITAGAQGLMTMVEIEGFAFETADPRDINGLQASSIRCGATSPIRVWRSTP